MLGTLLASIFSTSPASRAWTATGSSQTTASMVGAAASALTRVSIGAEFDGMTLMVTLCALENGSSTTRVATSWYRPPFIMMLMLLTCEEPADAGAALVADGAVPADGVAV